MHKIMIVDDEKIVRDGIKFIIEKYFSDQLKVVGDLKSGREAIEEFDAERPAIILMDIEMPGINGIQAIREIKKQNPYVKCIIVSAYEQFEYAQQSVEIGVKNYLLKPINKEKFIKVISKVIDEIEYEKEHLKKEIETQEKLDKILPVLEQGYIYSILMNVDYDNEIRGYTQLLDIKMDYGYVMVIEFGESGNKGGLENKIGNGFKNNSYYRNIKNTIKYKCKAIVGPLMLNKIVVLIFQDKGIDDYKKRVKAIELGEDLYDRITAISESEFYIGIGRCYEIMNLNASYNEAVKAIKNMSGEKVLHIEDICRDAERSSTYTFELIKHDEEYILRQIEEGNGEGVQQRINLFFEKLYHTYIENLVDFKRIILELVILMRQLGYRFHLEMTMENDFQFYDVLNELTDYYEIRSWCLNLALKITENIKFEKAHKTSKVISEAVNYIEVHYNEDLRLKDVAKAVAISPQYFCKIFKEELGVNFVDYITNMRIEMAKKMIRENRLAIKEISYILGYHDPNYFSRLFKKVVGISPSEYK